VFFLGQAVINYCLGAGINVKIVGSTVVVRGGWQANIEPELLFVTQSCRVGALWSVVWRRRIFKGGLKCSPAFIALAVNNNKKKSFCSARQVESRTRP